jgi:hypothetical protein
MPAKDKPSKKAEQKKKNQVIEDRTFGLKNKNKSKKVQSYVQSVTTSVLNSGDRKQRQLEEQRKQQRAEQKSRKKAMEDEQNALFNEALGALNKKSTNLKEGKTEAKGRDADDEGAAKKGTSRAMKMMFQMDGKPCSIHVRDPDCCFYVPRIVVFELVALMAIFPIGPFLDNSLTIFLFFVTAKEMEERLREDVSAVDGIMLVVII